MEKVSAMYGIKIERQYHADIMVTAVLADYFVVASIHDHELFNNGIQIFWN